MTHKPLYKKLKEKNLAIIGKWYNKDENINEVLTFDTTTGNMANGDLLIEQNDKKDFNTYSIKPRPNLEDFYLEVGYGWYNKKIEYDIEVLTSGLLMIKDTETKVSVTYVRRNDVGFVDEILKGLDSKE